MHAGRRNPGTARVLLEPAAMLAIVAVLGALSQPISAQWFRYPMPGVPKTAAGLPNLKAPAPRTADGKPASRESGSPTHCHARRSCATAMSASRKYRSLWRRQTSGPAFRAACRISRGPPHWWKQRTADFSKDDPHARCLPSNIPRALHAAALSEGDPGARADCDAAGSSTPAIVRSSRTAGRCPVDPQPSWNGYSSAKWDGDALVVDTIGLRDDLWLDMSGNPLTWAARLTERIRRPSFGGAAGRDGERPEGIHETVDGDAQTVVRRGYRVRRRDLPGEREIRSTDDWETTLGECLRSA